MDVTRPAALLENVCELVNGRELHQLTDREVLELHTLLRQADRILGFTLSEVLGDVDMRGLPLGFGYSTSESWLAATERVNVATANKELRVARDVVSGSMPTVNEAWSEGHLDVDRADVVVDLLAKLVKHDVARERRERAEELLAAHGSALSPGQLTKVAKEIKERLVENVEPWDDDPTTRTLTVSPTGVGGETFSVLNGTLDQAGTEVVNTALDVFGPKRHETPELSERQRRGEALVCLAEYALSHLTQAGPGSPAKQVVTTVPFSVLSGEAGVGCGGWTGPMSAAALRQLACDAGITIVVTGEQGEVLDVGRSQRFVTDALRSSLVVRDGGCVWPECHRPSSQTEAHHLVPWAEGGGTSLENLALFCSSHHHLLHAEKGWVTGLENGIPYVLNTRHARPRRAFHARFLAGRMGLDAA